MKRIFRKTLFAYLAASIVTTSFAGCSEKKNADVTTEEPVTTTIVTPEKRKMFASDTTASAKAITTTETTTTNGETLIATEETKSPFVDDLPEKSLDIIAPKIIELPLYHDVEGFPNKNGLLKAQKMFYNDVFLRDIDNSIAYGVGYGYVDEEGNLHGKLIESPEDVPCSYYIEYDLDYDGETEYIVLLYYYSMGSLEFDVGKMLYYIDGNAEPSPIEGIKMYDSPFTAYDCGDKICLDCVGYRYGTLTTFENGKADKVIGTWPLNYDERGFWSAGSPGYYYEPIVLYTADHKFLTVGWNEISMQEFEKIINQNESFAQKVKEKSISISDIEQVYTIGFLSFLLVTNSTSTYVSVDDNWYGVIGGTEEEYTHGIDLNKLNIVNRE